MPRPVRRREMGQLDEQRRASCKTRWPATEPRTEVGAILQEVGVYQYRAPARRRRAYKDELERSARRRSRRWPKAMAALSRATTFWAVNGSVTQGRKMGRDFSKLMLRAYNAEADNPVAV